MFLSNLNKEELEKYRQEKKHKVIHSSDDELRELIDTITSKTLAGDIQAASSLLSDLMATSIMDPVEKPEEIEDEEKEEDTLTDEKLDVEELKKLADKKEELAHADDDNDEVIKIEDKTNNKKETNTVKDESFYTRSMDLSEADFELEDEFKEKKGFVPFIVKVSVEKLGKMVGLGSQTCESVDDFSDFNLYFGNILYKNVRYVGEKRDMPIIIKKHSEIHTLENIRAENCDFEIQGWEGRK